MGAVLSTASLAALETGCGGKVRKGVLRKSACVDKSKCEFEQRKHKHQLARQVENSASSRKRALP